MSDKSIKFSYDPLATSEEIINALHLIERDFPIEQGKKGINLTLSIGTPGPSFTYAKGNASVSGGNIPELLRAMSVLRGYAIEGQIPLEYNESPQFETLGLMLDCSRNAVSRVSTVKFLLRRMALMGMNVLMLYTEETYEVPGRPMIGSMRGKLSQKELKELDDYASTLGIEMFPCIQALAHLGMMLRWPEFANVVDTSEILLVDEPETYKLIEDMLRESSKPYRSKRIHIGMDEAHGLGTGRFKTLNGQQSTFDIMNRHLDKVVKIADKLELKPMIWSDMYFRIGSKTDDYYDMESQIPSDVAENIPENVQLVYWDYYHDNKEFYLEWIDRHRGLGKEPIFAPGLWSWSVFWPSMHITRKSSTPGMMACKEKGVKEAITTAWGDNGTEVDLMGILPGLQYFADHGYNADVADDMLKRTFAGNCGENVDPWLEAGELNYFDFSPDFGNPSTYLLWQDPLLGILDAQLKDLPISEHYGKLARSLKAAAKNAGMGKKHLLQAANLAHVLELKGELGVRILDAYQRGDMDDLKDLANKYLPETIRRVKAAYKYHAELWLDLYKANGWETIDRRYAGLLGRLNTTKKRLDNYLDGKIKKIEELEEKRIACMPGEKGKLPDLYVGHAAVASPSIIV